MGCFYTFRKVSCLEAGAEPVRRKSLQVLKTTTQYCSQLNVIIHIIHSIPCFPSALAVGTETLGGIGLRAE